MALRVEHFGDVERLRISSAGGRAVGLDVSAYVIRGTMIDTGSPRAEAEIAEAVVALRVRGAIVTHWHEDHAGNVERLARMGLPIAMCPDTEAIVRNPRSIQLYRRAVWGMPRALVAPVTAFDTASLKLIHTPGHSSDHQVVFDRETGTLFSGDLWLGIHARVMHTVENPYEIANSVRIAAALSPVRMFDAHRGHVAHPVAALTAKAEWLDNTIGEVERRIREGWSDRRIVKHILGGEEKAAWASRGEYSRRNFVRAIRRRA